MNINRKQVLDVFAAYVKQYNDRDEKVKLKIDHTYRVSGLCEQIAKDIGLSEEEVDIAWLTGMLHDIGRFEQLKNYGTFIDADSIDHAEYGADILYKDGLIRKFIADETEDTLLEKVVRCHSAYRIPETFDERTKQFANILRDADKIDILKVNVEVPLEEIYNVTTQELKNAEVTEAVMEAFKKHQAIFRDLKKVSVDYVVGHISLTYELVYPVSVRILKQQGYLEKLLQFQSDNPRTRKQFQQLQEEMEQYLKAM